MKRFAIISIFLIFTLQQSFAQAQFIIKSKHSSYRVLQAKDILTGAERFEHYLPQLEGKKIAIVANHTSIVADKHLVDTLLGLHVDVVKVFSPEHGFRGTAAAGEKIDNQQDQKTGLPIISLYGKHKKPTPEDLQGIDLVIFDIQDVGLRFYTYISTLHLVMEACAENNVKLLVLDRPNPHGYYIDGPVLEKEFSSFVGMDPIPVVHGLTVGEYAKMVNGEFWLKDSLQCKLEVVTVDGYVHSDRYQLPIAPSPNLPNMAAVYLYPSLCFFEGTSVSIGRGTTMPFQVYGHPKLKNTDTSFIPTPNDAAPHPKLNGKTCYGYDLSNFAIRFIPDQKQINLFWLMDSYEKLKSDGTFFSSFFDKLAGTDKLRIAIKAGVSDEQIRNGWNKDIQAYKSMRKKYLLYPDFEL